MALGAGIATPYVALSMVPDGSARRLRQTAALWSMRPGSFTLNR